MKQTDEQKNITATTTVSSPASQQVQKVPQKPKTVATNRKAVRNIRFVTVKKKERTPFPFSTIAFLVVITILFLFMMMNYAEIDKYNSSVTDLKNEVASLQNEQKKLEQKLENKDDRVAYEQYAAEELGMVKSDTLNKYIISLSPEDKTEIMEYEKKQESGFGFLLSGIAEVIRDFVS